MIKNEKNHYLLLKKLKNTESAQLWTNWCQFPLIEAARILPGIVRLCVRAKIKIKMFKAKQKVYHYYNLSTSPEENRLMSMTYTIALINSFPSSDHGRRLLLQQSGRGRADQGVRRQHARHLLKLQRDQGQPGVRTEHAGPLRRLRVLALHPGRVHRGQEGSVDIELIK